MTQATTSAGEAALSKIHAYAAAGFGPDLLPIIPPDARVSASSRHPGHVARSRGKIPGKFVGDGWVGYGEWTAVEATAQDIEKWAGWPSGVGLQGRNYPGLDIDVSDAPLADKIEACAILTLGAAPVRFGNGTRRLLTYAAPGLKKRRLAFRPASQAEQSLGDGDRGGGHGAEGREPASGEDKPFAVELLGAGQQYVVEGTHPKTGLPYWWRDGQSPAVIGPERLTVITVEQVEEFFTQVAALFEQEGYEIASTTTFGGGGAGAYVHQDNLFAPSIGAIQRALAVLPNDYDYDTWFKACCAIKAASGATEEGYDLFEAWSLTYGENTPDLCRDKWDSAKPPFRVGWWWLSQEARKYGFSPAREDFGFGEEPAPDSTGLELQPTARMFAQSVWVDGQSLVVDRIDGRLRDREQFNAKWWEVGPPHSKDCAWNVFLEEGRQRATVQNLTYRPGQPEFAYEPSLAATCYNTWRPGNALPEMVSEAEVQPYLEHLAYLFDREEEVRQFLDWQTWIVRYQHLKPHWGVVIGSAYQGNGKSILMEPLREAFGRHNVRNISADDMVGNYSGWILNTKLAVGEEMHTFERRATMNRLKNYLASPPDTLRVNPKFGRQLEVPNILAFVFFTNHEDSFAFEAEDRRFFVLWSDAPPQEQPYYVRLVGWLNGGGAAKVAAWLRDRQIADFSAQGRAPPSAAKEEMRKATRTPLDEWMEDGIVAGGHDGEGVLGPDLVVLRDLQRYAPSPKYGQFASAKAVEAAIRRAGGSGLKVRLNLTGEQPATITPPPGNLRQVRLFAIRNVERYIEADPDFLIAEFWRQREACGAYKATVL